MGNRVSRNLLVWSEFQFTGKPEGPTALDVTETRAFAAIDRVTSEIRRRLEQPGMEQLISLEHILIGASQGRNIAANKPSELLGAHTAHLDISRLSAQLVLPPTLLRDEGPAVSERDRSRERL